MADRIDRVRPRAVCYIETDAVDPPERTIRRRSIGTPARLAERAAVLAYRPALFAADRPDPRRHRFLAADALRLPRGHRALPGRRREGDFDAVFGPLYPRNQYDQAG